MENFNDSNESALQDILREIQKRSEQFAEVTFVPDILPESNIKVIKYGDVDRFKDFNHQQGTNPDFQGTCGLVACEDILKQFGQTDMSESKIIEFAVDNNLCNISDDKYKSGGTTVYDQKEILSRHEIPSI